MDDILEFEESKARTTRWGRHYFEPSLLHVTICKNGAKNNSFHKCDADADDDMNVDQGNVEADGRCTPDHFPTFIRLDGPRASPFSWSDAPKMSKDVLYRRLGDVRRCIQNAILVVQPAVTKFDEAVQQSSFMKQVYEELLSLHRNDDDGFLWTRENAGAAESSEGDGDFDRESQDSGGAHVEASHSSGTSLPSSVVTDSSENSDQSGDGLVIYESVDSRSNEPSDNDEIWLEG